jgi:hypothetical protein
MNTGDSDSDRAYVTANYVAICFASFLIDEIIASAKPRFFGSTDTGDSDRAYVTADPAAICFASFLINEIIVSAKPWGFELTDRGGPDGDKTKYPMDSCFAPLIDAINTSAGPRNIEPIYMDGYTEYPRITSELNMLSNLTFATISQSVEGALEV